MTDVTSSYGLSQFVVGSSHKFGHTLDLVFANIHEFDLPVIHPLDLKMSDHFPVFFNLPSYSKTVKPTRNTLQCRNISSIDRSEFSRSLCDSLNSNLTDRENLDFKDHYKIFSDCASEQINRYAPLETRSIKSNSQPAWMDSEYRLERITRRRLERTWKASRLHEDKLNFLEQQKKCAKLVTCKRTEYFSNLITKCEGDNRALFSIVNTVMDKRKTTGILPECNNPRTLANQFNNFYSDKVSQIRNKIKPSLLEKDFRKNFDGIFMESFTPTSVDELRTIIKEMGIKTSGEDTLPGSLCKDIIEDLLPYYCDLVNKSLLTGSMEGIKDSVIIPLLKKSGTDPEM